MDLIKSVLRWTGCLVLVTNLLLFVVLWYLREWLSHVSPTRPNLEMQQVVLEKGGFFVTPAQAWWLHVPLTFYPLAMLVGVSLMWTGGYRASEGWPSRRGAIACLAVLVFAATIAVTPLGRHFVWYVLTASGMIFADRQ